MDRSPNLNLPYLAAAQAQKHVTLNEALEQLDALIQLSVVSCTQSTPPESPVIGERYIVPEGANGDWANHDSELAVWDDDGWAFLSPQTGWRAYVEDEAQDYVFDGNWVRLTPSVNPADQVGVNTLADATNRLAVKSDAVLFSHDDTSPGTGDMRQAINKSGATNTASTLYQSNYSARAEMGLTGDDNLSIKVSPDGATWFKALQFDRHTGKASFPSGGVRETLSTDRHYYVRNDGNDANNGLNDTPIDAFATIQHAIDIVAALDLASFTVTLHIGPGVYDEAVRLKSYVGAGPVTLVGDTNTPANVTIYAASGYAMTADAVLGAWHVSGFTLSSASGCIYANAGSSLIISDLALDSAGTHYYVRGGANLNVPGNQAKFEIIQATCTRHAYTNLPGSTIAVYNADYTFPAGGLHCSDAFCVAIRATMINMGAVSFDANAAASTGKRYRVTENGIVSTLGGGATFLPGDQDGLIESSGVYT